jgi:D-tyrosyl-tRNA(Tyr) deacylase
MRILIQRVSHASVSVVDDRSSTESEVVGEIGPGLVAFVGIRDGSVAGVLGTGDADTPETAKWMAEKLAKLRVFEDETGKMNLSVSDIGGSVLAVSQFTLYGDSRKGSRPNFLAAAPPEKAEMIYEIFLGYLIARLGEEKVASGRFRAKMQVELVNEGPVTILLER